MSTESAAVAEQSSTSKPIYVNLPAYKGRSAKGDLLPAVKDVTKNDGSEWKVVTMPAGTEIAGIDASFYEVWLKPKQVFANKDNQNLVTLMLPENSKDGKPFEFVLTKGDEKIVTFANDLRSAALAVKENDKQKIQLPRFIGVNKDTKDRIEAANTRQVTNSKGELTEKIALTLPAGTRVNDADLSFYTLWLEPSQIAQSMQSEDLYSVRLASNNSKGEPNKVILTKRERPNVEVQVEDFKQAVVEQREDYLARKQANYEKRKAYAIEHTGDTQTDKGAEIEAQALQKEPKEAKPKSALDAKAAEAKAAGAKQNRAAEMAELDKMAKGR